MTIATQLQGVGYTTALVGKYLNLWGKCCAPKVPPGWTHFVAFDEPFGDHANARVVDFVERRAGFRRLDAALLGSEHELVRSFMDAVAVWQDAESWGYVRDLSGLFVRAVSLPGSNDASTPPPPPLPEASSCANRPESSARRAAYSCGSRSGRSASARPARLSASGSQPHSPASVSCTASGLQ